MAGIARVAQLEHLAEDRDPPTAQAGQHLERGQHRRRRGVVAVVDHGHVAETDELAAMRCPGRGRQPGDDRVEVQPGGDPDRGRGQTVVDGMAAEPGDRRGPCSDRGPQLNRIPSAPTDSDPFGRISASAAKPAGSGSVRRSDRPSGGRSRRRR